jgi:monoamine oxidase
MILVTFHYSSKREKISPKEFYSHIETRGVNMPIETDVIIVGAGFSGLYAAKTLLEQGIHNFFVLEAKAKLGGRVQSAQIEENLTIDLGGQWVSSKQKRMMRLINELHLETVSSYSSGKDIYEFLHRKVSKNGSLPPVGFKGLLELLKVKVTFNRLFKKISSEKPWESSIAAELDIESMDSWINKQFLHPTAKSYFKMIAQEGACVKLQDISFLDTLWCMKTTGSIDNMLSAEEKWLRDGAQSIAEKLSESFRANIRFNSPVTHIDFSRSDVLVKTSKETFSTKQVIITVPIHITNKIIFEPPLPKERMLMVDSLPTSTVIKTILVYPDPFWRDKELSGSYFSDTSCIQLAVDTSDKKNEGGILTLFTTGERAKELGDLNFEQRKDRILHNLESIFGESAQHPLHYIEKDWSKEEWIRGGYGTHFPSGMLSKYGHFLTQPVGPLHWAGTETATEWRLYMEGALQSGERAAQEVINLLK